jgi:hypothetical protein
VSPNHSKCRLWQMKNSWRVCNISIFAFLVDWVWNVMAHAQKPDFVFPRNGRVHLNRRRHQFSRLLAAEVCASAVVMLDTTRSEVVWRVLATHSIRQFPLHFPSRASPCAITFQLDFSMITNDANVHVKLNTGLSWWRQLSTKRLLAPAYCARI